MSKQSSMWGRTKSEPSKRRALVLGAGGQDGSYMCELLLSQEYEVHGMVRRSSGDNLGRIAHILDKVTLHKGDLSDGGSIDRIVRDTQPHEIYNLADQDHVRWSDETPDYSADVTYGAVGRLLETIRQTDRGIKLFQPTTALMFAESAPHPQKEASPISPRSPYAVAKTAAYYLCQSYRLRHGIHVCCGILYNHESPRRGGDYLLQKLCRTAVAISRWDAKPAGQQCPKFEVGSLDTVVDIGYAEDYVRAMYLTLQHPMPDDYIIGTGAPWKIRDLIEMALKEAGVRFDTLEPFVTINPEWNRPGVLVADRFKASMILGWVPRTTMAELVEMIVEAYKSRGV